MRFSLFYKNKSKGVNMAKNGFVKTKTHNIFSTIMGCNICGKDIIFTTDICYKDSLCLNVYNKKNELIEAIDLNSFAINSIVTSITLEGAASIVYSYEYIADGAIAKDKYMKKAASIKKWGDASCVRSAVYKDDFDWEGDEALKLSSSETVSYLLHIRGYSMEDSKISKNNRGRFLGIIDRIPYFSTLGINQLVVMPSYDFDEVIKHENSQIIMEDALNDLPGINYWGYCDGFYFAPKSAYAYKDEVSEFKRMVKELHKAGIEIIMQVYFKENYSRRIIVEVLKHWTLEYHVDGFYLMGADLPSDIICDEDYLSDIKLYFDYHNLDKIRQYGLYKKCKVSYLNNDFAINARRFLKSDDGVLSSFVNHIYNNPSDIRVINHITLNQGFTLYDLVCFDQKHNEDNLENNKDGNDYNFSWNCGIEGYTRKKNVNLLRSRQIKNILTMLMVSQGTPLLLGGDENLNGQNGNNNAYCQDNKIGHVDWKESKDRLMIQSFLKELIKFRKDHPILRMDNQMKMVDSLSCGYPDMSFHQEDAFRPSFDTYKKHIAVMLCGKYSKDIEGNCDDDIYIAFNMHWDMHDFALPKLPKDKIWEVAVFTGDDKEKEAMITNLKESDDYLRVPYRSVCILRSSTLKR